MQQVLSAWRWSAAVLGIVTCVALALVLASPDGDILYCVLVVPLLLLGFVITLLLFASRRLWRICLQTLVTLLLVAVVSTGLLFEGTAIRGQTRWVFGAQGYKARVLAAPPPASGDMRHMEWELAGIAPSGYTVTYLVFDATNSIDGHASPKAPIRVKGVPCQIIAVNRMEKDWYTVQFFTDDAWEECASDRYSERRPLR